MIVPGANGLISLSIPLVGGRSIRQPYQMVQIDYSTDWQRDHIKTLETVYGKAPFFYQYESELKGLYGQQVVDLVDWNTGCLEWVFQKIKIKLPAVSLPDPINEELKQDNKNDFYLPSNYIHHGKGPFVKYPQIFEDKIGFQSNLTVLDMLFNVGPRGILQLLNLK